MDAIDSAIHRMGNRLMEVLNAVELGDKKKAVKAVMDCVDALHRMRAELKGKT